MSKEPEVYEQERWLPIANVARLMKNTLPASAKVSKDAKECMQECVSEFISFITSEASDYCSNEKRKTINGEDILLAMNTLGFENYSEALKIYLAKYRHQLSMKNTDKRRDTSTSNMNDNEMEAAGQENENGQEEQENHNNSGLLNEALADPYSHLEDFEAAIDPEGYLQSERKPDNNVNGDADLGQIHQSVEELVQDHILI